MNQLTITERFPHQTLAPSDVPDYVSIKTLHVQLNANVRSVASSNTNLGHLGLTLSDTAYSTINKQSTYVSPKEPQLPTLPTNGTVSRKPNL